MSRKPDGHVGAGFHPEAELGAADRAPLDPRELAVRKPTELRTLLRARPERPRGARAVSRREHQADYFDSGTHAAIPKRLLAGPAGHSDYHYTLLGEAPT